MEALEDLLSDTDCEGHLNFRPSGQFSFASIRRQLENEGVEEEEFEDEDLEEEQELDDNEGSDEDAQLTRGLWDISALGIGKNHDYLPQADELDEDEEFCEGQQLPSAFSEAPTALPDDAFSSRAPTKRPSLKEAEELQEDGDDHGDDEDFFPPFHRTPELANHWDISALGIDGKDTLEDDEGGLLHGNSVLLPSKSQGLQGLGLQPSEAAAPEAQKSGTGTPGSSTKRPFLKKGSRAKSTLPGSVPVVPPSRAAPTGPGSASQSVAPKKEIRKPVRPDPLDHFLANANLDMGKAPVPPVLPKAADLEEPFQKLPPKNAAATPLDQKDFDDSMPWDCRGDLDDLKLQEDEVDDLEGEPPTSDIVRSYFHPQRRPQRSAHWEGGDAFSTLYGRTSPGDGSLSGARQTEGRKGSKSETEQDQTEAKARLQALDEELKKYEKENENLKKLQAHAKQAERDIAREREKLWKEVEAERTALHAEFDVERAALRKERKRLAEVAERQRSQLREERENAEEKQRLTDRAEQLEEEMKEKEKRWQRTVDRLQRQVTEFTRKNAELQDEVQRLNQQVAQTQQSTWLKEVQIAKRGISARTKRANSVGPTQQTRDVGTTKEKVEEKQPRNSVKSVPQAEKMQPSASSNDGELRETRKLDGRVERIFVDGRREVEFSNGLKKVMWPDGQTSVMFQNGDLKEIRSDGVVVYHYRATGAVQTTLTDGTELYQFSDGQTERHSLDGSKEIRFPNGTTKKIYSNGSEEVCFADGTIKTTPDKPPK